MSNLAEVKAFMDKHSKRPNKRSNDSTEARLGTWIGMQQNNYTKMKHIMENEDIRNQWKEFVEDPKYSAHFMSHEEVWMSNLAEVKAFMDKHSKRPTRGSNDSTEARLGAWIGTQQKNYTKMKHIMANEDIRNQWKEFVEDPKYSKYFQKKKKSNAASKKARETEGERRERQKCELSDLHQKYKTMTSTNLRSHFERDLEAWHHYHKLVEANEETFHHHDIPRNRIIAELDKKRKTSKKVIDMGCGLGQLAEALSESKLDIYSYDHVSAKEHVVHCDISNLPHEDESVNVAVLSLAMWGSNCENYVKEAHRVLEEDGILYMVEPTKRWSEGDKQDDAARLRRLLEETGFRITEADIGGKFSFFKCTK